jgi:hypothetical protein
MQDARLEIKPAVARRPKPSQAEDRARARSCVDADDEHARDMAPVLMLARRADASRNLGPCQPIVLPDLSFRGQG